MRCKCVVLKMKADNENEQDPRATECIAALAALSKFSELLASASDDQNYNKVIAKILRAALQHGVQVALDGAVAEKDMENLVQIRTWLASLAGDYGDQKERGNAAATAGLH